MLFSTKVENYNHLLEQLPSTVFLFTTITFDRLCLVVLMASSRLIWYNWYLRSFSNVIWKRGFVFRFSSQKSSLLFLYYRYVLEVSAIIINDVISFSFRWKKQYTNLMPILQGANQHFQLFFADVHRTKKAKTDIYLFFLFLKI